MSATNKKVTNLNDVGEFKANFGIIIGITLAFVFVVIGIFMMIRDDSDKYLKIKGFIVETNCDKLSRTYDNEGYSINKYICNIIVAYKIDGIVYSRKMYINGSNNYIVDEPIDLMVLKKDYESVQISTMDETTIGCIFVTIALSVICLTYLNYYLSYKYKTFIVS
jgi:hypothetical protein